MEPRPLVPTARERRRRTFRRARIAFLAAVLVLVGAWGARTELRRAARTTWERPVRAAVVLLVHAPVPPRIHATWAAGLPSLERWFADEMARYRDAPSAPVELRLYGPVVIEQLPPFTPPDEGSWIERAEHAWSLSRALAAIDRQAEVLPSDARIYVLAEVTNETPGVEGLGAVGGDFGYVRAGVDDDLSMALTATAHELLHCLGATDKYDAAGHARVPEGLVEPGLGLGQRYAEIMVGELPLGPDKGRTPLNLSEVRVGDETAREIRWRAAP